MLGRNPHKFQSAQSVNPHSFLSVISIRKNLCRSGKFLYRWYWWKMFKMDILVQLSVNYCASRKNFSNFSCVSQILKNCHIWRRIWEPPIIFEPPPPFGQPSPNNFLRWFHCIFKFYFYVLKWKDFSDYKKFSRIYNFFKNGLAKKSIFQRFSLKIPN